MSLTPTPSNAPEASLNALRIDEDAHRTTGMMRIDSTVDRISVRAMQRKHERFLDIAATCCCCLVFLLDVAEGDADGTCCASLVEGMLCGISSLCTFGEADRNVKCDFGAPTVDARSSFAASCCSISRRSFRNSRCKSSQISRSVSSKSLRRGKCRCFIVTKKICLRLPLLLTRSVRKKRFEKNILFFFS